MNSRAYAEVYQIIQYLPESEYKLIPKSQIDYIRKNMDASIKNICTLDTKLEDIELSIEAKTMLLTIFYMYIANDLQRAKLEKFLACEEKKKSEEMYKNMFKKNGTSEDKDLGKESANHEEKSLVEIKNKKWQFKIINFFNKILEKLKLKK